MRRARIARLLASLFDVVVNDDGHQQTQKNLSVAPLNVLLLHTFRSKMTSHVLCRKAIAQYFEREWLRLQHTSISMCIKGGEGALVWVCVCAQYAPCAPTLTNFKPSSLRKRRHVSIFSNLWMGIVGLRLYLPTDLFDNICMDTMSCNVACD